MSRSTRHTPVVGIARATSEQQDKRKNNRRQRRGVRTRLATEPEAEVLPHMREVSDVWGMAKDGKIRIDPRERPRREVSSSAGRTAP